MSHAIIVYRFGGRLLFVPLARLEAGGHVESHPVSVLPGTESAEKIGEAIQSALDLSGQTVAVGASESIAQMAAGASSWTAFVRKADACDVSRSSSGYAIAPLKGDGAAFLYTGKSSTLPAETGPDDLAQHVLACLDADA